MGIVLGLHLLLACGFMLYFFHVPPTSGSPTNVTAEVVTKVQQQEGGPVQEGEVSKEEEKPAKEVTSEKRSVSGKDTEEGGGEKLSEPSENGKVSNEEVGEEKQTPAETGEPKDGEAVSGGVQNSKTADSG